MLHNILYNRGIRVGLVLCLLIVGGSLLYYEYVKRSSHANLEQTQQKLQEMKGPQPKSRSTGSTQLTEQANAKQNEDSIENASRTALLGAVQDNTENHSDATLKNFSEEIIISEIQEEIIAEEEMAQEALSAEELRKQELKQQQQNIFEEIKALMATEGGALDSSTDKRKMEQMLLLQKELLQLQQEIEGTSDPDANYFVDLAMMVNRGVNENGEMPVSEALKIADYMDADGSVESANTMRAVIQRAIDSGDEVIKSEHIEAFR